MDKTKELDVIIVGAGIAGLSAGYYAALNNYRTSIFEMHRIPGGLCTAWERQGYIFDISMHMLMGSRNGTFHKMWKELGVIDNFEFHYHDHLSIIEGMGYKIKLSTKREELEKALLEISADDKERIKEFMDLIFGRHMMNAASLNAWELVKPLDTLRALPHILPMMGTFKRFGASSIQEYAEGFKHPFLKQVIRFFMDAPGWPMPDFPMVPMAGSMHSMVLDAGVPMGGSQKVIFEIAKRFRQKGGTINYNKKVSDLIIENDNVKGIRLSDGSEIRAKQVIWAADGHHLHFDILERKYLNDRIEEMYETWTPVAPVLHVLMGVNMDFSDEAHRIIFEPSEAISIGGKEHKWLAFMHHGFDPSSAPERKTAVEVWYATDYDFWEKLYQDKTAYNAEKKRIADYTVKQLDQRYPGFANKLEVVDVSSPSTYVRYTGNWKGSPDGWYITRQNMRNQKVNRTLPNLKNFWMAGQWTAPFTGTVIAALSGRQAVQLICKKDRKRFQTS